MPHRIVNGINKPSGSDTPSASSLIIPSFLYSCSFYLFPSRLQDYGLLLPLLFLSLSDMSMADVQSPWLSKAQDSTMRKLSSMVSNMAPWTIWNTSDSNPCLWSGVTCYVPSQHSGSSAGVLHLSMSAFGLSDSTALASSICSLDTLQSLDLSKNRFTDFPQQLVSCPLDCACSI